MEELAKIIADLGHPMTYFLVLGVLWSIRSIQRIDRRVVELDIKVTLLLSGHKVVNNAPGTTTDVARLL